MTRPRIAVLLASFNGEKWISQQITSIISQIDCDLTVFVSDDSSSDQTLNICRALSDRFDLRLFPLKNSRFGNANRNFLRLVKDCSEEGFDFFCFADQDDVWFPDKLSSSVKCIIEKKVNACSSNVLATWNFKRFVFVKKSYPLKKFDHFFESAGPGCTFVFDSAFFSSLKKWVEANYQTLMNAPVHDWVFYAFARESGFKWHIQERATMLYRQHRSNEYGVNAGLKAALKRVKVFLQGGYFNNCFFVASLFPCSGFDSNSLKQRSLKNFVYLFLNAHEFRRSAKDVFLFRILLFFTYALNSFYEKQA